jgi:hypothetical protein
MKQPQMPDMDYIPLSETLKKQFQRIFLENIRNRMGGNGGIHKLSDKRNSLFRKFK